MGRWCAGDGREGVEGEAVRDDPERYAGRIAGFTILHRRPPLFAVIRQHCFRIRSSAHLAVHIRSIKNGAHAQEVLTMALKTLRRAYRCMLSSSMPHRRHVTCGARSGQVRLHHRIRVET